MHAESGSRTQPSGSVRSPRANQSKFCTIRFPPSDATKTGIEIMNPLTLAPTLNATAILRCALRVRARIPAARSGSNGISQKCATTQLMFRSPESSFHGVDLLDIGALVVAVNSDNQCEAHSRFGRRDADGKNHEYQASRLTGIGTVAPECDEIEVPGVEHQFDSDQDQNCALASQSARQADAKQER